jgi:hypothetical protein
MNSSPDYYPTNEDKFGFLVFDKKSIDNFLIKYSRLEKLDSKIIEAIKALQYYAADAANPYANHTNTPESMDFDLAYKVLDAVSTNREEKYFSHALKYLFFYECLPKEFQYKWLQNFLGDFQFNVTFFKLLRNNSATFDQICCSQGHRDKDISKIWGDFHPNEINTEKAKDIKADILQSTDFTDHRFQKDKEHFLNFLNNVIAGKWRLFLLDWN